MGLSCLSGAHNYLFRRVCELLREKQANDITIIAGGVIPDDDITDLKKAGVKEVFLPGSPMKEIIEFVKKTKKERRTC